MAKIGVVLSGSGVYDGSEIHESVLTLYFLDKFGATTVMMAPNVDQAHVVNHLTGEVSEGERRNVLVEAARIARGKIKDIKSVRASDIHALIFPGGYGAAKNLSSFAFDGVLCKVNEDVVRLAKEVYSLGKPVGAMCIAPAMMARIFGEAIPLELTIGTDKDLERDETEDEVVEESDDLPMEPADIDIEVPQEIEDSGSETSVVRYSPLQHYLAEIRKYRFLTKEEEFKLAVKYREGGDLDAVSKLVMANLKIVVVISMEYKNLGMNLMDLIQEGNLGLMQAVKKFDPYRDIRLVTYATWWIRAYILRYIINNWRLVKIGTTQAQRKLFFNLMKEKARLESLGYEAGPKLIAHGLGVKEKEVIEMGQRLGHHDMSVDEPLSEDSESTLLSVLSSGETPLDDRLADDEISSIFKEKVAEFSKGLNERDLDIMQNRILSEEPKSLSELGRSYDISKERVRQLESNLIKRLKEYLQREVKDFDALRPD